VKIESKIPALGYALLGLLQQKPASGYDLRKAFSSTSLRSYSDSPGAIYPALSRLAKQGLIVGKIEKGRGIRQRQMFRLTPQGLAELKKWVTKPVTREELIWGQDQILLRFAFSEQAAGRAASLDLLKSLQTAVKAHLPELRKELQSVSAVAPASGRLAFEFGVRGYEGLIEWVSYAIATYERERKGGLS
jgi:PadR family transcriptional regulator AphA